MSKEPTGKKPKPQQVKGPGVSAGTDADKGLKGGKLTCLGCGRIFFDNPDAKECPDCGGTRLKTD